MSSEILFLVPICPIFNQLLHVCIMLNIFCFEKNDLNGHLIFLAFYVLENYMEASQQVDRITRSNGGKTRQLGQDNALYFVFNCNKKIKRHFDKKIIFLQNIAVTF